MNYKSVIVAFVVVNLVTGSSFSNEVRPEANNSTTESVNYVQVWRQTKLVPAPTNQSVMFLTSARKVWDEEEEAEEEEDETGQLPDIGADELIESIKQLERDAWDAEEEEDLKADGEAQLKSLPVESKMSESYKDQDESLPDDLSDLPEDIADDIAAGVEESLTLSASKSNSSGSKVETRQFPIYMFQGSYMAEPRLNRFIDGAIRNMGTELRISVMDPLYFRVLPKGLVEPRPNPNRGAVGKKREGKESRGFFKFGKKLMNKMNPFKTNQQRRRRIKNQRRGRRRQKKKPATKVRPGQKVVRRKVVRRKPARRRPGIRRPFRNNNNNRNRNRNKKRRPGNKNRVKNNNKNKKRRQKRRLRRHVGGGRVEGLSCITRDGDAEMQVFGNFTLVRSHMKMGPVELAMQFRTRRGLRRTGATLPYLRVHTVTRVSQDGSEMVDFLLDRPHPETIKIRGRLFPKAERIARNIFSRLFVPNSFLTSQLRDKAGLALLSKPKK